MVPTGYLGEDCSWSYEHDIAKAKALLDMFGYVDRDGDGYRENPDGSRLELKSNSSPTARDQQIDELWKRSMDDIGIRITFRKAKWPDLLKESDAGKLMPPKSTWFEPKLADGLLSHVLD